MGFSEPEQVTQRKSKRADQGLRLQPFVRRCPGPIISIVVSRSVSDSIANK
jgi:hypothetical protein